MKAFLILVFGMFSSSIIGQDHVWSGKVVDTRSGAPLIGVNIFDSEAGVGGSTDSKGKFQINIDQWPLTFTVSYLGYTSQLLRANTPEELPKSIELVQDQNQLEEIVVTDKSIPSKVSNQWKSIVDFVFIDNRILYVETGGNFKSSKLVLADLKGSVLDEMRIADFNFFQDLYLSCRETPFAVCEYVAIQLDVSTDKIVAQFESNIKDFNHLVRPCKAANEDYLYHGQLYLNDEKAKITQIDLETLQKTLVTEVYDENAVDASNRSRELIGLYSRFVEHTKNPFHKRIRNKEVAHLETYSRPVDYNVFTAGPNVLVMDHMNSEISYFDQAANPLKVVPIYYNQEKNWTGMLRQDQVTEAIYIVIQDGRSLILHELDVKSGNLKFITYLDVDSIDRLEVHNKTLWYTASKLVGPQIGKQLYKLDL